jgi:3-dehydroquinate synthase
MAEVEVILPHERYKILIEPGVLENLGARVRECAPAEKCALFTDSTVGRHYGALAKKSLQASAYQVEYLEFAGGEQSKSLESVRVFYDALLDAKLERTSPVIALGGGVVGDTAGFAAATYLRGVPLIQCPTSLLAMVDASVGGKVGVNVPQGKNLIGSFHQPKLVLLDPRVLRTLDLRELRCGFAECVKHGILGDSALFEWTESSVDALLALEEPAIIELLSRNTAFKARIVAADEKEKGMRALLNLGHTFGHAIEKTSAYAIPHGEAVSLGIAAAAYVSVESGRAEKEVLTRSLKLLERFGLPVTAALAPGAELFHAMKLDKKIRSGTIRLVLPLGIGRAEIADDIPDPLILEAFESIRS